MPPVTTAHLVITEQHKLVSKITPIKQKRWVGREGGVVNWERVEGATLIKTHMKLVMQLQYDGKFCVANHILTEKVQ